VDQRQPITAPCGRLTRKRDNSEQGTCAQLIIKSWQVERGPRCVRRGKGGDRKVLAMTGDGENSEHRDRLDLPCICIFEKEGEGGCWRMRGDHRQREPNKLCWRTLKCNPRLQILSMFRFGYLLGTCNFASIRLLDISPRG